MASGNDVNGANIKSAMATYEGFLQTIKVAMPVIAVIVVLVIYLLAH